MTEWAPILSVGTLIALIGGSIKVGYVVRDIRAKASEDIAALRVETQRAVADAEKTQAEDMERMRHQTGEMGSALRQKAHDMETWNRDTFVRKDSFEMVIGRLEKSIEKLGDKLEEKLERFAERITGRSDHH